MIGKTMLRNCSLLGAAAAAVGCAGVENMYKCRTADPDTRIAACTALIQEGHKSTASLSLIFDNRGAAYHIKRDYDHAIEDYNQAIRLNPNNAAGYLGRGASLTFKKDYDHAIDDLSHAIQLSPNYAPAYFDRGGAYDDRGVAYDENQDYDHATQDYNQAIQDYNDAIRLKTSYASAFFRRGVAYDRLGIEQDSKDDYDRAIQELNEAIRLSPTDAIIYNYRGLAEDHEGDYARAIQNLSEAIRLNPKYSNAYLGSGVTYIHTGDLDRAIQDLNEAIRLGPNDTVAFEVRGEAYLFQSNLDGAIADLENAIAHAPTPRMAVSAALVLHTAMKKKGRDDSHQLAQVAASADLKKWPGPLLQLDLGRMTANEVMTAAANPADQRRKWHICQANYFIGEDALFRNQRSSALVRLKAARDGCPKWDLDNIAAVEELKRLGVTEGAAK
jgi:tetratricopeptide (TPR) repeat protein